MVARSVHRKPLACYLVSQFPRGKLQEVPSFPNCVSFFGTSISTHKSHPNNIVIFRLQDESEDAQNTGGQTEDYIRASLTNRNIY